MKLMRDGLNSQILMLDVIVSKLMTREKNVCLSWRCSSVGKSEALGSIATLHSPGIVTHVCNPSTREMQAGESGVEGCL